MVVILGAMAELVQFSFRQGWVCEFMEEDRQTRRPRMVIFRDERKLFTLVAT
jgi:hypothetical protein